jgi:zinc protease
VYEALQANAFVASPQRAPVIGWMNDLQAMTVEDAIEWYGHWYAPNNAIVVVVGDVKADEVLRVAERTYGMAARRALPSRKPQLEPPQKGIKRVAVKAPAENPYVILGFHVPKLQSIDSPDREPYALEVLAAVLDADENGRLTRELVRASTRLADSAGASYDMTLRGPALFLLDGTPAEGKTSAELEQALRAQNPENCRRWRARVGIAARQDSICGQSGVQTRFGHGSGHGARESGDCRVFTSRRRSDT